MDTEHDQDVDDVAVAPIVVHVENLPAPVQEAPADVASWSTYVLAGDNSTAPQQLLGQLDHRHKAQIIVTGGAAGDYVVIGRMRQQGAKAGARIPVGTGPIPYESKTAAYLNTYQSAGQPIYVTVIEELYAR